MISFHIEKYDGPLDLLLDLVQKHKMDISDIQIVELTEQFLAYIESLEENDLGVSSEFVVMASHLLWIKSKMLLPKDKNEEEDDPREELAQRLLEYQQFKEVAGVLGERQNLGSGIYEGKPQFIAPEVRDFTTKDLTFNKLFEALNEVLARKDFIDKKPTTKDFTKIMQKNRTPIMARARRLLAELEEMGQISFFGWFDGVETKDEIIAGFLAVLELLKQNKILFEEGNIIRKQNAK